jgi:hypothetical protein
MIKGMNQCEPMLSMTKKVAGSATRHLGGALSILLQWTFMMQDEGMLYDKLRIWAYPEATARDMRYDTTSSNFKRSNILRKRS